MSAAEALDELSRLLGADLDVNLVLGSLDDDGGTLSLAKLALLDEPQDMFRINARSLVRRIQRARALVPYAPGYKPETDEVLFLDLEAEVNVRRIVHAVGRLQAIDLLSDNPDVVEDGGFSAQVIGGDGASRAIFFAQFTPKNELARRRGVSLVLGRDGYDVMRRRVFLFDDQADCIAYKTYLYIWSQPAFERMFRFFEQARTQVDAVVATIVAVIPISNEDAFKASCRSQPQMIAKALSIGKKPYLRKITIERIKTVIAAYGLAITTTIEDGVEKLLFENDPAKRWLILKLLDDDYLYSEMTDARYAANSKNTM